MRAQSISEAGLDLIKRFEGFRAEPAPLAEGGWLVGYGHVRIAEPGQAVTPDEADELLKRDLAPVERFVNSLVTASIGQGQFDALVSFCFSVGQAAFEKSDVLRKVNAGQIVPAACAMDAWRKSSVGGDSEIFDILIRRRAAEKALFLQEGNTEGAPSAYLRAEKDHAAAILGAPVAYGAMPDIGALPKPKAPELSLQEKLDSILRAEPATTLVLTQVVPADVSEGEINTANARPVARKLAETRRRFSAVGLGLWALAAIGFALVALGAAIMFAGGAGADRTLGGFAIAAPGVIAAIAALYGLWGGSKPRFA